MARTGPVRVMIVEDSAVVRMLLSHIIAEDPQLVVAAAVASAEDAIAALPTIRPDIISMDISLPGMDGLEATRQIMAEQPTPIVVISASIEKESLGPTMEALSAGALSVVEKPVGVSHRDYAGIAREIRTQLRIMSDVAVVRRRLRAPPARRRDARAPAAEPKLIACAASTGGPQALARLLGELPVAVDLPILLVQHMGAPFMAGFVKWLDGVVGRRVTMAEAGVRPEPGLIYVAPGDRHLRLDRSGRIAVADDGPIRGQRPAATALFQSVAETLGAASVGVVLTGMGEDGASGVRAMIAAGAPVLAEEEASAVVYGMPAAAVREGATPLSLADMARHLGGLASRAATGP